MELHAMATPQPLKAPADFKIGVLTSGGDAQGMNAAGRAGVRTALAVGAQPYAVMEGWAGAVKGGDAIKKLCWSDVSLSLIHNSEPTTPY